MSQLRKVFGPADASSVLQMERCLAAEPETALGALMADHHKGYSMPIGGVVAYKDFISPSGVGFDIGCGNLYAETDIDAKDVDIPAVMEEIRKVISFGIGRPNAERIEDHPVYDQIAELSSILGKDIAASLLNKGRQQLGTVGSGNHYVDLFENRTNGKLGVGVHFGSRGLGHTIASGFMAVAQGGEFGDKFSEGGMDALPLLLRLDNPSGQDYETAMNVGLHYAYAGREWVVDRIVRGILQGPFNWSVHNNHNYAAREIHHGLPYLVHRKGATPAFPGQMGFVGATMGEDAVIVEGVNTPQAEYDALFSTVHGAGRAMSRTAAAGKVKVRKQWVCGQRDCGFTAPARDFSRGKDRSLPRCPKDAAHKLHMHEEREVVRAGAIDWDAARAEVAAKGIYLVGAGADEAPGAYKRLDEVLGYHTDAIRIVHQLRPLGVAMAGADVFDPYKD